MEGENIILGKAEFEDWEAMYRNVWSRPEAARYMLWKITTDPEEAQRRMERTIEFQKTHDAYLVYEKKSGQAVGFAGLQEIRPHIYEDAGICLGPEYVGKGYGKEILNLLLEYCADTLGGMEFYYSTRTANTASKALAHSCGFSFHHFEQKTDPRDGEPYVLECYNKKSKK